MRRSGAIYAPPIGRVTVLTNPASGHGNAPHAAEKAVARLQQRGIDVVAIVGSDADHARRLLHAAIDKGTDALVVVGGDGVITDALQALAGTEIPLGIVPAGTGNDHAREFGLPTKDPAAAADIVADGWTETIDLGRIPIATAPANGSAPSRQRDSIRWSPTGPTGCVGRVAGCATTSPCSPSCHSCDHCLSGWCWTGTARSTPT